MKFVLTNGNLTTTAVLDVVLQFFKVADSVVGDTDGTDLALLLRLDECLPGSQATFPTAVGTVDQHAN